MWQMVTRVPLVVNQDSPLLHCYAPVQHLIIVVSRQTSPQYGGERRHQHRSKHKRAKTYVWAEQATWCDRLSSRRRASPLICRRSWFRYAHAPSATWHPFEALVHLRTIRQQNAKINTILTHHCARLPVRVPRRFGAALRGGCATDILLPITTTLQRVSKHIQ